MSHLELVALVVREYEPAIEFFVNILRFELVEDVPSLSIKTPDDTGFIGCGPCENVRRCTSSRAVSVAPGWTCW